MRKYSSALSRPVSPRPWKNVTTAAQQKVELLVRAAAISDSDGAFRSGGSLGSDAASSLLLEEGRQSGRRQAASSSLPLPEEEEEEEDTEAPPSVS